ncbi:MAG: TIR domain-containing protein, partial [Deltaproteobacteria bacterium]|nr:TIR domain-containing protein [Deltaproteobacteria bacterium]
GQPAQRVGGRRGAAGRGAAGRGAAGRGAAGRGAAVGAPAVSGRERTAADGQPVSMLAAAGRPGAPESPLGRSPGS